VVIGIGVLRLDRTRFTWFWYLEPWLSSRTWAPRALDETFSFALSRLNSNVREVSKQASLDKNRRNRFFDRVEWLSGVNVPPSPSNAMGPSQTLADDRPASRTLHGVLAIDPVDDGRELYLRRPTLSLSFWLKSVRSSILASDTNALAYTGVSHFWNGYGWNYILVIHFNTF